MAEHDSMRFRYRARTADGQATHGDLLETSRDAAMRSLASRQLLTLAIREVSGGRRLPDTQLADAFAGLAALLESGLPLERALGAVAQSSPDGIRGCFDEARTQIGNGLALADALDQTGDVTRHISATLRAGEAAGSLATTVRQVALDLTQAAELRESIRSALTYPVFLFTCGLTSLAVIGAMVLPRFSGLIADAGTTVPPATRALLAIGALLEPGRLAAIAGLGVVAAILAYRFRRPLAPFVQAGLDGAPVLGALRRRLAAVRLCRTLASLLKAGLQVPPALLLAAEACGSPTLELAARLARGDVLQGERLSRSFERHSIIPPRSQALLAYGDEAGRLADFLGRAAVQEEAALRKVMTRTVALLEPVLIVAFGGVIAFAALGLLQTLYGIRPAAF